MPEAGSTERVTIFSGVLAATASISTPPSVEATKAMGPAPGPTRASEPALRPGLGRDQRHAEDAAGLGVKLRQRLDQLDAAALAPSARVNLRLHHEDVAAESAGVVGRFLRACRDASVGHRCAIRLEQGFGLVFVDVYRQSRLPARLLIGFWAV